MKAVKFHNKIWLHFMCHYITRKLCAGFMIHQLCMYKVLLKPIRWWCSWRQDVKYPDILCLDAGSSRESVGEGEREREKKRNGWGGGISVGDNYVLYPYPECGFTWVPAQAHKIKYLIVQWRVSRTSSFIEGLNNQCALRNILGEPKCFKGSQYLQHFYILTTQ